MEENNNSRMSKIVGTSPVHRHNSKDEKFVLVAGGIPVFVDLTR
jgi:hypothetical protein